MYRIIKNGDSSEANYKFDMCVHINYLYDTRDDVFCEEKEWEYS